MPMAGRSGIAPDQSFISHSPDRPSVSACLRGSAFHAFSWVSWLHFGIQVQSFGGAKWAGNGAPACRLLKIS
jgi:hypothetical protein